MLRWLYKFSEKEFNSGSGLRYRKPREGFMWLHLTEPTEAELARVKADFRLSAKMLKRFPTERRSIRYSFRPLAFTIVDYHLANGRVEATNILYIVGDHFVITIANKKLSHFDEMFDSISERLNKIMPNTGHMLYEILDSDSEENFDVLAATEKHITELEEGILEPVDVQRKVSEVIQYKRYLLEMWRRFWGSSKILFSIKKGLTPIAVNENLARLFDDVHDTYIYQMEIVTAQREALTDALTIYETILANKLAQLSNHINKGIHYLTVVVLLLTGITLVISIPNTIATIGGIPYLATEKAPLIWAALLGGTAITILWFLAYWRKVTDKMNK